MTGGRARLLLLAGFAVAALTGCELKDDGDNLVNGKTLFVEKCSQCHTLARAGAKGVVGPDLDQAWQRSEKDGLGRSTYKGVVHQQILEPNRNAQNDPVTGKPMPLMQPNIVTGEDAQDVAAYVAYAAAAPGEDPGRLADAGGGKPEGTAKAEGGTLEIPVGTGLTYEFAEAEAPAGPLTIESVNEQPVEHNIAVDGNGVDEKGEVVTDGGTSTVEVDLEPGEYAFYCSVPGHREGGMEGPLTIR
jgi:mono/diheme cytochrome c family protein